MEDTFAVFYDHKLLVVLTGFKGVLPEPTKVLDWYAKNYAFDRARLGGGYAQSVSVEGMKYEDFQA